MLNPKAARVEERKASRNFLVKKAQEFLSRPYKYGASPDEAPETFDCSSFTQYVYKWLGINLPRSSNLQAQIGRLVRSRRMRKGDLIFFRGKHPREVIVNGITCLIGHVGIYISRHQFIHCSQKKGVSIKSLKKIKYPIILIRRII